MGGRGGSSGMRGGNPFPRSLVQDTVYHSTNAPNITTFSTGGAQSNGAIFFASDEGEAELHGYNKTGREHYTYEVNLDIQNPKRVTNMEEWGDPDFEGRAIRQAKRQGYDSVIFDSGFDGDEHAEFYAVFSPSQVKIKSKRRY